MIIDAVIAVRNQASAMPQILDGVRVPGLRRITVVDRGSVDDTAERARALGAIVLLAGDVGLGRSYALAQRDLATLPQLPDAVLFAPAEIVRRPHALAPLLAELTAGADLCAAVPTRRTLSGLALGRAIGQMYGRRIVMGRTVAIKWPALVALGMNTPGAAWHTALAVRALRLGLVLTEVPYADEPTHRHISASDILQLLRHATLR